MRVLPIALACCTVLVGLSVTADLRAESIEVTPEITVFSNDQPGTADDNRPTILRGSATKRGTVDSELGDAYEPARFQFGTGDKLWMVDPVSGRVAVCDERRTSRVGSRYIGCVEDRLPYAIYE